VACGMWHGMDLSSIHSSTAGPLFNYNKNAQTLKTNGKRSARTKLKGVQFEMPIDFAPE